MTEGYTPELLEFLKKNNPDRTEEKIIRMIQNTRVKTANKAKVNIDRVSVILKNNQVTINLEK